MVSMSGLKIGSWMKNIKIILLRNVNLQINLEYVPDYKVLAKED